MMTRMKKAGILVSHQSDDPHGDAASSCHAGTSKLKYLPVGKTSLLGCVVNTALRMGDIPAKVTVKKMTKKSYEWRIPSRSSSLTLQHLCTPIYRWQADEKNLPTITSKSSHISSSLPCRNGTAVFAHSQMNYGRPGIIISNYFWSIKRSERVGCSHEILAGFSSL